MPKFANWLRPADGRDTLFFYIKIDVVVRSQRTYRAVARWLRQRVFRIFIMKVTKAQMVSNGILLKVSKVQ